MTQLMRQMGFSFPKCSDNLQSPDWTHAPCSYLSNRKMHTGLFQQRKGNVHLRLFLGLFCKIAAWLKKCAFDLQFCSTSLLLSSNNSTLQPGCLSLNLKVQRLSFPAAVVRSECHIRLPSHAKQTPSTIAALIFHWLSLGITKTQCVCAVH